MRQRFEFLLTTVLVILTRIGDGLSTHLATPDLSRELNPLGAGGWPALIATAAVVLALSTALNYCYVFRPVDNFPQTLGLSFEAFKRHYFDPHANPTLMTRTGSVLAYVFGYIVPRTLIAWSLLLIANNLFTAFGMVFTFVAGGDLAVLWTLRGVSGSAMVRDHPERVGCYIAA